MRSSHGISSFLGIASGLSPSFHSSLLILVHCFGGSDGFEMQWENCYLLAPRASVCVTGTC